MVLVIFAAVTVALGFLMGRYAESKGYGFWNWFFASSLLGIIWIVVIPNLKKDTTLTVEQVANKVNSSNTAGIIVSVLGQIIALFQISSAMGIN
jgi:hypothetical protein